MAKAITWQALGLVTTTAIAYAGTGAVSSAFGVALASASISFVLYFLHERAWNRLSFGKTTAD